jgi:MAM domain, meprin/A5/mu
MKLLRVTQNNRIVKGPNAEHFVFFFADKVPVNSWCTFEDGMCGWRNVGNKELEWNRHSGKTPTNLTGPSVDHTLNNSSGILFFQYSKKINPH